MKDNGRTMLSQTINNDRRVIIINTIIFIIIIFLWEFLVRGKFVSELALARPNEIISVFATKYLLILSHLKITLIEIAVGFICGLILSVALALIIVHSKLMSMVIYPWVIALNSTAKVAIAPLILLLFGTGALPIIVIVVLISFLPLMNNLIIGLKSVDSDIIDFLRINKANRYQILRYGRLPASLPYFFSGVKTSAVFSVKGAIIGEVFQATDKGLGFLITQGDMYFDVSLVYAASLVACLVGILLFFFFTLLEKEVLYWHKSKIDVWN